MRQIWLREEDEIRINHEILIKYKGRHGHDRFKIGIRAPAHISVLRDDAMVKEKGGKNVSPLR